ncbi:ADOP family duplicated permease [Dokdonella soli]|uniref:ABC transporter permease n=1 Tax=Dokdonella soli TaxID=529810 RepID=A0ABN1IR92_9GAMM
MNTLLKEFRNAARGILARPAFSALVVGVLGAGLACVIFMLSMLNGFVLRPLPFAQPDQLLQAGFHGDGGLGDVFPVTSQDLIQIRHRLADVAAVGGIARSTISLSDLDQPQRYNGAHVSANLFQVLGIAPLLGRDFAAEDERPGAPLVAILSHELWQARYGGDPAIVGRQVRVDAHAATVIGVMPKNFSYPRRESVWVPAALVEGEKADAYAYWPVLRRHADIGDTAVVSAFESWFADAARADPARFRGQSPQVEPLARMAADRTTRSTLGIMLAAVFMVLIVACANAANLLLTRTLARSQELSVRVALGAARKHLITHLLAESSLLSLIATVIGLALARAGVSWQQSMLRESEFFPLWLRFDIDDTVVLFALGAALLTALVTGVLPALHAGDMAAAGHLRDGSRSVGSSSFARVSRVLVIGEVALSCALLICVGTVVRGIFALDRSDLGVDTHHLLTARVALVANAYPTSADQLRLYERVAARLRLETGVVDATVGTALPGTYFNEGHTVLASGVVPGDGELPQVYSGAVDEHFAAAYGIKLEQGRFFDSRDRADSDRVAVVDRTFVTRYGNGESVLGRQFRLDPRDPKGTTVTVIGVIGTLTLDTPGQPIQPAMLVPLSQNVFRIASIAVRTQGDPLAFAPRLAEVMREVDADTPLYWLRDYPAVIRNMTIGERSVAKSFGAFGIIALILAAAGLYGVMSFTVGRRTREIGVRRALGAPTLPILRNVFGRSLLQLGGGLVIGVVAGLLFARQLTGSLQSIEATDSLAVLGALGVLTLAATLAVIVPVRCALRVDPMVALRNG